MYLNFWFIFLLSISLFSFLVLVLCFMGLSSFSTFLVVLEFLSLIIILLLFVVKEFYCGKTFLVYYLFQVFFFLLMVWGYIFKFEVLFYLRIFLKLGLFPFVWWLPYVVSRLRYFSFFLLGVVNKVLGFYIFVINYSSVFPFYEGVVYFVSLATTFVAIINSFCNQNKTKALLVWSSAVKYSMLVVLFASSRLESSLLFFIVYSILLSIAIYVLNARGFYWDQALTSKNVSSVLLFICFISFVGLPPFLGFYCKFLFFYGSQMSYTLLKFVRFFPWILLLTLHSFIYINMLVKLIVNKQSLVLLGGVFVVSQLFVGILLVFLTRLRLIFKFV